MKFNYESIITELLQVLENQTTYIHEKVIPLEEDALTWRPRPNKWNIFETLEHLNRFGDFYLPLFTEIIKKPKSLRKSKTYSSGFLGENILKRTRPKNGVVPFKTKTPTKNDPFLRILDRSVIDLHLKQQEKFKKIINGVHELNLSKNYIRTMVSPYIKLSSGDSIRLFTYHMERHFVQIDNLVNKLED